MAVKTDSEIRRLEGVMMIVQQQIDSQNATLREQTKALEQINKNLTQLNTTLMGIPDTEDKGLYGKVCKHDVRIAKIERVLWPLIAVLAASNVISISNVVWG